MKQPRVWETEWLEHELKQSGVWDKLYPMVVDCGAGDGEYCSNSKLFIREYGWAALLLDGLDSNIQKIRNLYDGVSNVTALGAVLSDKYEDVYFDENPHHWSISKPTTEGKNKLSTDKLSDLLYIFKIEDIGVLSLDIEGNETKVLKNILNHNILPQVLIVEGNDFETMQQHRDLLRKYYGEPIGGIFPNQFFLLNDLK